MEKSDFNQISNEGITRADSVLVKAVKPVKAAHNWGKFLAKRKDKKKPEI